METRLIIAFLIAVLGTSHGWANTLIVDPLLTLKPGELLRTPIKWAASDAHRVEVRLGISPKGARLEVDQDGQIWLAWLSSQDFSHAQEFHVVLNDFDSQLPLDVQVVNVEPVIEKPIEISRLPAQRVTVNSPWRANVQIANVPFDDVSLLAAALPRGAKLIEDPDQQFALEWIPGSDQTGVHRIRLKALKKTNISNTDEIVLTLMVLPEKQKRVQIVKTASLDPIPNQVISAGRVLSLPVTARTNTNDLAVVQIDRLPLNASFDINSDGSRTFYWQTGDRDQGEHLFRFSAFHPDNMQSKVEREVLIVVGDPSRNTSLPADN